MCSVGLIPQRLPFTASNTAIRVFRHALSLDERRAKFKANHYQRPSEWERRQGTHAGDMPRPASRAARALKRAARERSRERSRAKEGGRAMSPGRLVTAIKAVTGRRGSKDGGSPSPVKAVATVVETESPTGETKGTIVAAVEDEATQATVALEKDVAAGAEMAEELAKAATKVVEQAADAAVDAADVVEKTADAAKEAGVKLWSGARKLMKKNRKRMTEEEVKFDETAIDGVHETDVKEVWFAGCHAGECSIPQCARARRSIDPDITR